MSDDEFLARLLDCTLPFDQWTHRAHLKTAYLLLRRHPLPEAIGRMRGAIQAYNRANEVPEGQHSGYHETMTQAWVRLLDVALREFGSAETADAFFDQQPQLANKRVLLFFYSRDRIMSWEAKQSFVTPDLAPLPVSRKSAAALV